jgi:hypothetical protein
VAPNGSAEADPFKTIYETRDQFQFDGTCDRAWQHGGGKSLFLRPQFPSAAEAASDIAALTARLEAAPLQSKH